MYRSKDFYLKGVYDSRGKKLGIVKDIYIDFYKGEVKGIKVANYALLSKKSYVCIEAIINIDEDIIVESLIEGEGLKLSEVMGLEVIDKLGNTRGVVEDILIDEENYQIKGLIVSSGIIEKMIRGKEVILINRSILGENYILYLGETGIIVKNIPHEMKNHEYS
ncbi:PRC-barrel domain-containing protein [Clostridium paraputrificum]|uniref:PRC-barrel domain-containing protein n=1 Tax=Clostridium TaxID=1485 RepID=UPI003D343082